MHRGAGLVVLLWAAIAGAQAPGMEAGEADRIEAVQRRTWARAGAFTVTPFAAAGLDDEESLSIEAVSGSAEARRGSTYADFEEGEYGVLWDPRGWLTIVRGNPASALDGLGLTVAAPVWLTRAG